MHKPSKSLASIKFQQKIIAAIFFTFYYFIFNCQAFSQAHFITAGKIEYEKKTNMHAMMGDNWWADQMKDKLPQFRTTYFDFLFTPKESLFKPGRELEDDKYKNMWGMGSVETIIYNNYDSSKTIAQKQVFDQTFLLQDSLVKIEWRLTEETRKIAGFECRKAVGKFLDSLYVVAFYTEEIVSQGGPENFTGLPGLILGIGFPRMHYTLYATKLELQEIKPTELKIPTKGKKTNRKAMFAAIKEATKDWGKNAGREYLEAAL